MKENNKSIETNSNELTLNQASNLASSSPNYSIHDFEFQLICDYFSTMKRQGPGSEDITRKALSFIENLPVDARIADIGCGTGEQTITLAENTTGHITAIDLFPEFINILNANIEQLGYNKRVTAQTGSMAELPFAENELDLIWAEGSIYNIGFENGINYCKKFLKKDGYIAVSEATWFTNSRPAEIEDFWMSNYSEIDTISNKVKQMEKAGYVPVAAFILPENCWTDNFYAYMDQARTIFLEKHSNNCAARSLTDNQMHERSLYCKYKQYYGYAFYIGKKI